MIKKLLAGKPVDLFGLAADARIGSKIGAYLGAFVGYSFVLFLGFVVGGNFGGGVGGNAGNAGNAGVIVPTGASTGPVKITTPQCVERNPIAPNVLLTARLAGQPVAVRH